MPVVYPYISFLPIKDYYVASKGQRLYFNELALYDKDGYFKVAADGASYPAVTVGTNGVSDYAEFSFEEDADFTLRISYCYHREVVKSHSIAVHVRMSPLPPKKYLFIGDSLTEAGHIQNFFRAKAPESVILYGTRGTGDTLHEGRGSWGIHHYYSPAKGETVNPFYNPETETFDFSYYMQNNPAFADVDIVNIFLGRNNGFNTSVLERIDKMVASIKAYRADIMVTLMGAYNVAPDNSGTGRYLQSADSFNYAAHDYNLAFYEKYAGSDLVHLIPAHLNLDNKYDYDQVEEPISVHDPRTVLRYNNNVHPARWGYEKLGAAVEGFFRFFFSDKIESE